MRDKPLSVFLINLLFAHFFTGRLRVTPKHLQGIEGNDSRERSGRKRELARTCGADSEPEWRRAHRDSRLYAPASWAYPSSDHLWHSFEGFSDLLRPKPVSAGRVYRGHVSRHPGRSFVVWNNRHDFQRSVRNRHKHRASELDETIAIWASVEASWRLPRTPIPRLASAILSDWPSSPLQCGEGFYRTGDSVALAARIHRFHGVVVGRLRREVVQVHAEHGR